MTVRQLSRTSPAEAPEPRTGLVTIVVPVLNGARHVRESLESILGQTYPALEVIVMDDGSTDGTAQIVEAYEGVRLVRHERPLGIYANANAGIELAAGEFVGVFHADDLYLPNMVERQVDYLQRHAAVGAVFASDVFIDSEGRELGRLELPRELRGSEPMSYDVVLNRLLTHKNCFLRCPSALVRSAVYRDVGLYDQERFKNTSDLDMWLRIARRYELAVLEAHLFKYRRGHGSSSERYHRLRTEQERFFTIMDLELRGHGGEVATPVALAAYEAHRAEDTIMRALAYYTLGDRRAARRLLTKGSVRVIAKSSAVSRPRLVALLLALRFLTLVPRSAVVARAFERRWFPRPPAETA